MKELYRGKALLPTSKKKTFAGIIFILLFCAVIFFAASFLPFSWFFELAAIFISALLANSVMKRGTFSVTYVLYTDKLCIFTRYGFFEKQTEEISLKEAYITTQSIEWEGRCIKFYPDKKLRILLNL